MKGIDSVELSGAPVGSGHLPRLTPSAYTTYLQPKVQIYGIRDWAKLTEHVASDFRHYLRSGDAAHSTVKHYQGFAQAQGAEQAATELIRAAQRYEKEIFSAPGAAAFSEPVNVQPGYSANTGIVRPGSIPTGGGTHAGNVPANIQTQVQTAGMSGDGLLDKLKEPKNLALLAGAGVLSYVLLKPKKATATAPTRRPASRKAPVKRRKTTRKSTKR